MTVYVIKRGEHYLTKHPSNQHWHSDVESARTFMFVVIAESFAILRLDLDFNEYQVVPVERDFDVHQSTAIDPFAAEP